MPSPETAVRELLDRWIEAVSCRDVAAVTGLYHPQAQFWGTLATFLRVGDAEIRDYFEHFLDREVLLAELTGLHLWPQSETIVLAAGAYSFCWRNRGDEKPVKVETRFTFVCCKEGAGWRIRQHHSSTTVPEGF